MESLGVKKSMSSENASALKPTPDLVIPTSISKSFPNLAISTQEKHYDTGKGRKVDNDQSLSDACSSEDD